MSNPLCVLLWKPFEAGCLTLPLSASSLIRVLMMAGLLAPTQIFPTTSRPVSSYRLEIFCACSMGTSDLTDSNCSPRECLLSPSGTCLSGSCCIRESHSQPIHYQGLVHPQVSFLFSSSPPFLRPVLFSRLSSAPSGLLLIISLSLLVFATHAFLYHQIYLYNVQSPCLFLVSNHSGVFHFLAHHIGGQLTHLNSFILKC